MSPIRFKRLVLKNDACFSFNKEAINFIKKS